MTYEIFLADSCNRSCEFCWVDKCERLASEEEVASFISAIKSKHIQEQLDTISLFGGEPLLNIDAITSILRAFADKPDIKIELHTNGDFASDVFENEELKTLFNKMHWIVTAYDFVDNPKKYKLISSQVSDIAFAYTFTSKTIYLLNDFKTFAKACNVPYKIAFSHDPNSWVDFPTSKIQKIIENEVKTGLDEFINGDYEKPLNNIWLDHYLKLVFAGLCEISSNEDHSQRTCLDPDKVCFKNGKFLDSKCSRLDSKTFLLLNLDRCKSCDYNRICTKTCIAEVLNEGKINEKLCMFEKACFDAISQYAVENVDNLRWKRRVVEVYLNEFRKS